MARLFSTFTIKNLKLKNRIVMAPMCQYSSDEKGYVHDWHITHYATRAIGGVGLILLEATAVEPRGRISDKDLGIWADAHVKGLTDIVDTCKKYGAKVGIQLAHAGRKCTVDKEDIVAPSSLPFDEKSRMPIELTKEEIQKIIEAFKDSAKRAVDAGFDMIEIHGAHGYLINEFLSPLSNHRSDAYGGSLENRTRLLREVIEVTKEVIPKEMPLLLRISAEDYVEEGNHPEDLAAIINLIKDLGIDIINVSSGAVVPAKIHTYAGYQVPFSEIIKERTDLPTIAGGLISTPEMAEEILSNHRGDLIYLGRELLRNPYWPLQVSKALGAEIPWPEQYERSKI